MTQSRTLTARRLIQTRTEALPNPYLLRHRNTQRLIFHAARFECLGVHVVGEVLGTGLYQI